MNRIKPDVFDLSGTTVEDDNAVARCLHQAAVECGLEVSLEEFRKTIGTNKMHLYQFMLARILFMRYSEIMIGYYRSHVKAMPDAEEVFAWCHDHQIRTATDTGFQRDVNEAIMEDLLSGLNAGCAGNIGVLSGANTAETLDQYPHTHLLQDVRELPSVIEKEFQNGL